jgi:hypothetical protein
MNMRLAGASLSAIAGALGVSKQQSFRDVRASLAATLALRDDDAASYRAMELLRLDELLLFAWPHAQRGSAEHIRAAVRIAERRARLLGLDAQVAAKLELAGVVGAVVAAPREDLTKLTDSELADRMERTAAMLGFLRGPKQPEPEPLLPEPLRLDPLEEAKRAYAAELAERNGSNGSTH